MCMKEKKPICGYSGKPAEYQIGVAHFNEHAAKQMVGFVSADNVEKGITDVMRQAFGTTLWATVHNLNGTLLYHSYHADQQGYSAVVGWQKRASIR